MIKDDWRRFERDLSNGAIAGTSGGESRMPYGKRQQHFILHILSTK